MTMLRPTTHHAPLPALRAVVFALVGTVLGVSAHHLVAEGPMPWRQSALAATVLFAVGLAGARRPQSLAAVVAVCGAAQAGLHLWLMAEHPDASPPTAAMPMAMPAHMQQGADAHTAWHDQVHNSSAMTAVHAVAAVLVGVLLHRADTVCWTLARGLTTAVDTAHARVATTWTLLTGRTAPADTGLPALVYAWLECPLLKGEVLADVVMRRGPPRAGLTHVI
ncbi:hypothetical protein [Streptomyces sp. NPDC058457]|uniref:hypothetical protein n=1 Tax=Streptomyces sp. NPDC058457 TaxID=3346507 RepID=UPI003663E836